MRRSLPEKTRAREPTIALINIVFLMLIFFLLAGTIAPPRAPGIELVRLADLDGAVPSETMAIYPDGRAVWQGAEVSPETFEVPMGDDGADALRLLPDRDLPAWKLLEIAAALEAQGAGELRVVTERALE